MDYVKLEEICNITTGKHDANHGENGGDYRFYTCAIEPIKCPTYSFEGASIILPGNGANVGEVLYDDGKFEAYQRTYVLNSIKVNPRFVYYQLKGRWKKYICNKQYGSATNYIRYNNIAEFKIPLLSIEEQNKIVNLLDKADEIRAKKKLANDKLDELIDTKFIELFGNPEINPYNWTIKKLEDVTTKITDGVHSKPVYTNSGVPFISVKDITTKKLLFDDCKFISEDAHKEYCKRCKPEYLDVLYTKVGATYGRACVVDTTEEFSLYVSVALIKPQKDVINPFFLKAVLNTDCVKRQADKRIKGIGVPDLHLIEIKNFVIPVPPMEEQAKFIAFVEKVEAQKQKNELVIEQMNNLFNSLSQRAFKGEL